MPDIILPNGEQRILRSLHYWDLVFLSIDGVQTFNYDTGLFDGQTVPQGQYVVGTRARQNGIDVIPLGQTYVSEGKNKIYWFYVNPSLEVSLLQVSEL